MPNVTETKLWNSQEVAEFISGTRELRALEWNAYFGVDKKTRELMAAAARGAALSCFAQSLGVHPAQLPYLLQGEMFARDFVDFPGIEESPKMPVCLTGFNGPAILEGNAHNIMSITGNLEKLIGHPNFIYASGLYRCAENAGLTHVQRRNNTEYNVTLGNLPSGYYPKGEELVSRLREIYDKTKPRI